MTYHTKVYYLDGRSPIWCNRTGHPSSDLNEVYRYRAKKALDWPEYEYKVEEYK